MSNDLKFEVGFGRPPEGTARALRESMRILIMGDFSGRSALDSAASGSLSGRPTPSVDIDNFEDRMRRLAPQLRLTEGDGEGLGFSSLEDFHPDSLYRGLEIFKALRRTRERLMDPTTYPEAAAELKRWAEEPPPGSEAEAPPRATDAGPEQDEGTAFERLLGGQPVSASGSSRASRTGSAALVHLLRTAVEPHIVPHTDPQQPQLVSSIDDATAEKMRAVLHDPRFQELEAAWRGLDWLISNVETGEELKLHMLDVSREELVADLGAAGKPEDSSLYQLLVEKGRQTLGGEPWSVLVGHYTFGASDEDLLLLDRLGAIASHAGGPFLAAADTAVLGCRSLAATPDPHSWQPDEAAQARWQTLRSGWTAPWLGLALPRFLLRLPYGSRTDPVDAFEFEELPAKNPHAAYLWGNPALACTMLLATSFVENGAAMSPGDHVDVGDLPAHVFEAEEGRSMKACAEVCLTERAADEILASGLMPLVSFRDRNAARLLRFQSLADPPAALRGPWG